MLTADKAHLAIFESFRVDFDLPKYKAAGKAQSGKALMAQKLLAEVASKHPGDDEEGPEESDSTPSNSIVQWGSVSVANSSTMVIDSNGELVMGFPPLPGNPRRWWQFWKKEPKLLPEQTETLTVEEFFHQVKGSLQEIAIVEERAQGYIAALGKAKAAGQKALVEKLQNGLNAHRMEAHLVSIGMHAFVEEDAIVRFYKQSKRGLRLDWVSNFARSIPSDVVDKKRKADALGIFDNYAVLHFDPTGKSFAETEAEKAERLRPKDPILFGLMKGRTQLYVVGDWIDEDCDLTLDQIADALGKDSIHKMGEPIVAGYR
jgi:hypothetical protein